MSNGNVTLKLKYFYFKYVLEFFFFFFGKNSEQVNDLLNLKLKCQKLIIHKIKNLRTYSEFLKIYCIGLKIKSLKGLLYISLRTNHKNQSDTNSKYHELKL